MEILNQFGVKPLLLLAQVVNFLILLVILKKLFYQPVLKVLEERKKRIADSLKNAEEIERKLAEIGQLQEKEIEKATKIGQQIIKDATLSATKLYEEATVGAKALQERMVKQMQMQLLQEKEEFEDSLRRHVAELIFRAVQKATGKVLTKLDKKKIAEEGIKALRS